MINALKNMIVPFAGTLLEIPTGWTLCDGTLGTPDLRNSFLVGAGSTYAPDDTGGAINHTHTFTSTTHKHDIGAGGDIDSGPGRVDDTTLVAGTGTTDNGSALPPYHALYFIMKL